MAWFQPASTPSRNAAPHRDRGSGERRVGSIAREHADQARLSLLRGGLVLCWLVHVGNNLVVGDFCWLLLILLVIFVGG